MTRRTSTRQIGILTFPCPPATAGRLHRARSSSSLCQKRFQRIWFAKDIISTSLGLRMGERIHQHLIVRKWPPSFPGRRSLVLFQSECSRLQTLRLLAISSHKSREARSSTLAETFLVYFLGSVRTGLPRLTSPLRWHIRTHGM